MSENIFPLEVFDFRVSLSSIVLIDDQNAHHISQFRNIVHCKVTHATWKIAEFYDDLFLKLWINSRNQQLYVPRSGDIVGAGHTQFMISRVERYCLS